MLDVLGAASYSLERHDVLQAHERETDDVFCRIDQLIDVEITVSPAATDCDSASKAADNDRCPFFAKRRQKFWFSVIP